MSSCLLTSIWSWGVQFVLGSTAFLTLLYKRHRERPQRTWKIWWFDSSKQGIATVVVHFINVMLAALSSAHTQDHDPCTWYLLFILVDSTIGLLFMYCILKFSSFLIHKYDWRTLRSGDYGKPPQVRLWFRQMCMYLFLAIVEKFFVSLVMLIPFWQQFGAFISDVLGRLPANAELVIAMFLFPLVINAIWFWVVDSILQEAHTTSAGKTGYTRLETSEEHELDLIDRTRDSDEDSDDQIVE
eukprot:m.807478 g.807478  ORF g.807478 m.807478 type:complete len:242 (+) comp59304_c0_seq4:45-770(+)